ncbi:carboxylating nicotinate-nucleotide diphosphorylase [Candidatus Williamhamiltonella defendens]|uniref:carboxylating nicotinate-nucleotide diphosphorylase n=1 Tax=Candidatus Williamhamiltonella defendens TaxID=138072 RepID=UPI00130D6012|nr:carboxylating nicotinate-nucleotide diphosphorylase [Candidatus Hamiltonella defensa]
MPNRLKNTNIRRKLLLERLKYDIPSRVTDALKEDLAGQVNPQLDLTSQLFSQNQHVSAEIITRENGIFCGKAWLEEVFIQLDSKITITWLVKDGDLLKTNQILCQLFGPVSTLLSGERTALNFIQTLSGVATKVNNYVKLLSGLDTKILDTRKTLPGLRTALKYAVLCGGGDNHRLDLNDAFLIKENHIIALGGIKNAVKQAKTLNSKLPIEIEVESLNEFKKALSTQSDIIMLDNFTILMMQQAVEIRDKAVMKNAIQYRPLLEVSGNVTQKTLRSYAKTGIDYISVGDLTKNIQALDMSMRFCDSRNENIDASKRLKIQSVLEDK